MVAVWLRSMCGGSVVKVLYCPESAVAVEDLNLRHVPTTVGGIFQCAYLPMWPYCYHVAQFYIVSTSRFLGKERPGAILLNLFATSCNYVIAEIT